VGKIVVMLLQMTSILNVIMRVRVIVVVMNIFVIQIVFTSERKGLHHLFCEEKKRDVTL